MVVRPIDKNAWDEHLTFCINNNNFRTKIPSSPSMTEQLEGGSLEELSPALSNCTDFCPSELFTFFFLFCTMKCVLEK